MQKIAIIGGAGPRAGALMFKKIIDKQVKGGSWQDHEFPFILLLNIPFAPMMNDNNNKAVIKKQLQEAIDHCSNIGITNLIIACNTLHGYLEGLDFRNIIFHSLIESTLNWVDTLGYKKVTVVATRATKKNNLYNDARCEYTDTVTSDQINDYICSVLQQKDNTQMANEFYTLIKNIETPVILGCTELSVINADYNLFHEKEIIDPLDCVLKEWN